jgi:excisionase family DNA binding protein
MYLTVSETAKYLNLPESYIRDCITKGKIRSISDGEQHLINRDQFQHYFEQLEKLKELLQKQLNEPIPEDYDVKDED